MIRKRSVTIRGHRTSFSIEDEFMVQLRVLAEREGVSLARLVERIDTSRSDGENLSSALRLHVLRALTAAKSAKWPTRE